MTKNKLTSDAYYSMIREGLGCIVEDKSVKIHEQAFQLAKNDIEKFAKENNLKFASLPGVMSLSGDSLPTPKVINISTYLKNFLVMLPPDDISHDEIAFGSISDSKYKGVLFVVTWLVKEPSIDNLAMLLEAVNKLKLNFIAWEWNERIRADAKKGDTL